MANLKQLAMILKLRQEAEDKAAKMMQQAGQALDQQNQQLQTLRQYRNDYLSKMTERSQAGLTAQHFGHYQEFVTRLDDALGRAEQQYAVAKQVWNQRQQAWHQARAETQGIQSLIDKEETALMHQANRQEQKQLDEFATTRFARVKL